MHLSSTTSETWFKRLRRGLLIALASVALATPSAVGAEMTDQSIADAVEDEMVFDPGAPAHQIDVSVSMGVVTLTGRVGDILAKERAERIAETVKGVRSVINRVDVVVDDPPTDAALARNVTEALRKDAATDSYEVEVAARDGVVTLTGTVDSWAERRLSALVAKGVRGVVALDNRIVVNKRQERPDREIAQDIRSSLRWNTLVDHELIGVDVDDGRATLNGIVGSAAERREARRTAWVTGVESVDVSNLKAERWARDEDLRRTKYDDISADEIAKAIDDALLLDPRVMSFNVSVSVRDAAATLRGTVDNLGAKRAAEQVARNTVGVGRVKNRLKVRPAEDRDSEDIAKDIRGAFARDPYVERYEIVVDVVNGVAYLRGTVDSTFEKRRAGDLASRVNGVEVVNNRLDTDYEAPLVVDPYVYEGFPSVHTWFEYEPAYTDRADADIRESIEDQLWWSPFVESDAITVIVDDGVATLEGTVDSYLERSIATENALEGGAIAVDNDLEVKQ